MLCKGLPLSPLLYEVCLADFRIDEQYREYQLSWSEKNKQLNASIVY